MHIPNPAVNVHAASYHTNPPEPPESPELLITVPADNTYAQIPSLAAEFGWPDAQLSYVIVVPSGNFHTPPIFSIPSHH